MKLADWSRVRCDADVRDIASKILHFSLLVQSVLPDGWPFVWRVLHCTLEGGGGHRNKLHILEVAAIFEP